MIEVKNAKIKSTFFGFEDHGIFTFFLNLEYGSSGQGAGGYGLGEFTEKLIQRILLVCGVNSWEELPGKFIRVKADGGRVYEIGNILNTSLWLNFEKFFKEG